MSGIERSAWPRRCFSAVVGVIVLLIALPLVVPLWSPWSRINCRTEEIDLRTGQKRTQRVLWYVAVTTTIEETWISRTLEHEGARSDSAREWRVVNTFTPWQSNSPHHRYHSALSQIHRIEAVAALREFEGRAWTDEQRRLIAREVLAAC